MIFGVNDPRALSTRSGVEAATHATARPSPEGRPGADVALLVWASAGWWS